MIPRDILCDLRTKLDDTEKDYLWGDSELLGYLDQAYRVFAQETKRITDMSTANLAVYSVSAAAPSITLSDKVLDIKRAFDAANNIEFTLKNSNEMPVVNIPTGTTRYVCADREIDKLFLFPIPADAFTLTLQVVRYPLETFSLNMSNPLEFQREEYWQTMIHYAAGLAYLKDDVEVQDVQKGFGFKQAALDEMEEHRVDIERQTRTPGNIVYGGL